MTEQVSETGYTVAYDNEYGHFEMSGNFASGLCRVPQNATTATIRA